MLSQTAILIYASFALSLQACMTNKKRGRIRPLFLSRRRDLDPRPRDYKSRALPLSYAGVQYRSFASAKIQLFSFNANFFFIFLFFLIMRFNNMIQLSGDIFKQSIITRKINLLHLHKFYGML